VIKFGADVMVAERGQVGKGVKKNREQIWPYLCGILFNFSPTSVPTSVFFFLFHTNS